MYAKLFRYALALVWVAVLGSGVAYGQTTGKIAGKVVDAVTGEPLIGVNIVVTELGSVGAASDADGNYYILQVPPGTYTLKATYVGYNTLTVTDVNVRADLTSRVNLKLEEATTLGEEVVIVADDPIVRPDVTSTRRSTSREDMQTTPGMEQALDIFKTQGMAIIDTAPQTLQLGGGQQLQVRDESVKNIHVRGGRGGEILFLVDGMPVTHPIYGGRSVLELNVNDVEQVELLTGAFNAEYGQAQSGVVNITTRSGSERYEGGLEYRTDELGVLGESYGTQYLSFYLGGPELLNRNVLRPLGLALPGQVSFFLSGNLNLTNTAYDNGRTRGDFSVLGLSLPERQDNTAGVNAKIDWRPSGRVRLGVNYNGTAKRWSNYDWLWKNFPDHVAVHERVNHNVGFHFNHTLSQSTFYSVKLGYLGVTYDGSLDGQRPSDFWTFYADSAAYAQRSGITYDAWKGMNAGGAPYRVEPNILAPTFDPLTGFFNEAGFENIWRDDNTRTFTAKGDLSSQVHPQHFVKTGFELQYHDIEYIDVQDGGAALSPWGRKLYRGEGTDAIVEPPGPFPEFGQNRWVFDAKPLMVGAYVQDKFELSALIINAGARLDGFMPGNSVFTSAYKQQWEAATGLKADWARFRYKVSPRFGISFPISVKTVLFFSYGHFNQLPELQFFYRDPYTGGLTGNPHLDYEQTILYEFGFTRALADDWAIDVKSYTKDISQQVGTTQLQAALGLPVALYDNNGYARARGLEFILTKRPSNFTAGTVTYTVQWADGYASSAFDDYIRSQTDFPNPIRERRLSWDVRNQLVVQGTLSSPPGQPMEVFGLKLPDNWDLTVLSRASSGQPYTPGTTDPAEAQKLENTAIGPPIYSTDIKFRKSFGVVKGAEVSFFADVFNVFDQHNIQIAFGFNNWTGEPFRYGDVFQDSRQGFDWYDMYRIMDPRQFSTGRYAKLGFSLHF